MAKDKAKPVAAGKARALADTQVDGTPVKCNDVILASAERIQQLVDAGLADSDEAAIAAAAEFGGVEIDCAVVQTAEPEAAGSGETTGAEGAADPAAGSAPAQ